MPSKDVMFAGSGGQGVLLAGKVLAWAGMREGMHVTWFPSYGAEMRGGTANCTVILSGEEIGSPVVDRPGALVAMNRASADKFAPRVQRGGVMVLNSSLVKEAAGKAGVKALMVPANDIAAEIGNVKVVNMVMLGAYVGVSGAVGADTVMTAIEENLSARNKGLLRLNLAAFERGLVLAR